MIKKVHLYMRESSLQSFSNLSRTQPDATEPPLKMSNPGPIIIFGPTGKVGSAAALFAHSLGAKIILGMRDPSKFIPAPLAAADELAGGFKRVYADLTKPDTLRAAAEETGAKRAFVYLNYENPDSMKSAFEALKSGGVEFVVLLSSYAVQGELSSITPDDFIAWKHAQIELALAGVLGVGGFVAVRGGYFATNSLLWMDMINEGKVKIWHPNAAWDWVSPDDVGAVSGAILVKGPEVVGGSLGKTAVEVIGPDLISQRDVVATIAEVIGKEIETEPFDEVEVVRFYTVGLAIPEKSARTLVDQITLRDEGTDVFYGSSYTEAVGNILKYTRRPGVAFRIWAEKNKERLIILNQY
ncbi:NmrA-like family protein [Lasiosphaeria hispida]|uniref:NmrA-like family protein n=1 Tax=Lasiosphaeria hispida TaxID=260671 RepID=A0AAJ0H5G0_9PEZI|nr:NmrA-like family protein [Lasiosphaeria hispida]